jgi:hypothetical protein
MNQPQTALQVNQPQTGAVELSPPRQPTSAEILSAVVQRGITPDSAAVVREIVLLMREEAKEKARIDFAADFVALQRELPQVIAESFVCKAKGSNYKHVKGTAPQAPGFFYAKSEEIHEQIKPCLDRHNFAITMTTEIPMNGAVPDPDRITGVATLIHASGHERTARTTVRKRPSDSASDSDVGTATVATREAMCDVLGVMRRPWNSEDARVQGDQTQMITPEQAMDLEQRAKDCGANLAAILAMGHAATFDSIPAVCFDAIDANLRIREKMAARKAGA